MKLKFKKKQKEIPENSSIENKREILSYFSKMSIMVPVLLLSVLAGKMMINNIEQSQVVKKAIAKDKTNFARRLNFALYLLTNRDTRIETEEAPDQEGKPARTILNLKSIDGKFDYKGIHAVAVKLKQKYPEVFKAIVNVTSKISKNEIKKVLDSIRKREKADPKIYLVDQKTGKKTLLKVMFPDVTVAEGSEG